MEIKENELAVYDGSLGAHGFNAVTRAASVQRQSRIAAAAGLWADFHEGRIDPYLVQQAFMPTNPAIFRALCESYPALFRETMTTSDFNALTVDVLDRQLLGNFSDEEAPVMSLVKTSPLRDFRSVKRVMMDGMETVLTAVKELAPVPQRAFTESTKTYAPVKYEAGTSVSWEAMVNDDLGIFNDIPRRLAHAARRTINKFISSFFWGTTGPNTSMYTAAWANIINIANGAASNNPTLSQQGLRDAVTVLMKHVDSGGDPIVVGGKLYLVVGPSLYVTAQNLLHELSVDLNEAGGTTNQRVRTTNWIVANMSVIMDPYLPIIASSSNGATSWALVADPSANGRPAVEVGFLRGYDTPQLYQKAPNTMRIGGGIEPMLGDFQSMSTELKVLMVFGGAIIDGRSTVASNGSGA